MIVVWKGVGTRKGSVNWMWWACTIVTKDSHDIAAPAISLHRSGFPSKAYSTATEEEKDERDKSHPETCQTKAKKKE